MWKDIGTVLDNTWVIVGIDATEEQFVARKLLNGSWVTPTGKPGFDAVPITREFSHWMPIISLPLVVVEG